MIGSLASMRAQMDKEEKEKAAENPDVSDENDIATEEGIRIDPDKFLFAWNSFLDDSLKNIKPNLYHSLYGRMPEFTDEYTVTVTLENAALSDMLFREKLQMAQYFREKHGISGFNLKIDVKPLAPDEQRKYLSNPRDIYFEMVKVNPDLEKMQLAFGLELEG